MRNFLSLILIIIVTSCAPTSEQTNEIQDLEDFLSSVEEENKKDGPVIYLSLIHISEPTRPL